jgi:23S rRNA (cytosine1962-C5)-methyltransferase
MKLKTITLKTGSAKPLWAGNPFVYPKAADHWPSTLALGEWVRVADATGKLIGQGVFNPHSLYRIRMLHFGGDVTLEQALRERIAQAIQLRTLLHLPNPHTNVYRLINSEGDGLSGMTVDVFNTHAVIAVTGAWALVHRELLQTVLQEALPHLTFIWRPMEKILQKEGWEETFETEMGEPIQILENDIQYQINPFQGQKTGFYCDQRDTRLLVQSFAKNRKVLDICCYAGSFSLHAALGGALSVKGIDSSADAIAAAQHNAQLNQLPIEFEEADAMDALNQAKNIDFIILDPPKLAPSHKHLQKALKYYHQLNEAALKALPENGLLLTCSCSQAVSVDDLQHVVRDAALSAGKHIQILKTGGAGCDHPVHAAFPEGDYLKWLFIRILNGPSNSSISTSNLS